MKRGGHMSNFGWKGQRPIFWRLSGASWPWNRAWPSPIMSGFHGAFATGVACQQGTLTLPDTWFRPPFWDLLMLQLLRPNSSNLPCLYSTFHLEYPLVLSRFCLEYWRFPKLPSINRPVFAITRISGWTPTVQWIWGRVFVQFRIASILRIRQFCSSRIRIIENSLK